MDERDNYINKIVSQRDNYVKLFNDILKTSKESYMILDVYYTLLNRRGMRLQISVIVMSSLLTCIQAGRSMDANYRNYENLVNNTSFFDEITGTLSNNNMIYDIMVLGISTYSSLSLSIMRYFKWDDKREVSSELKGKFLELHNRINYQLDIIRPWNAEDYYDNIYLDTHTKNWNILIDDIEREYKTIIELKKGLVTECDKLLTEKERIRFQNKILKDEIYRNFQERKLKRQTLNHKHDTIRIEEEIVEIDKRQREIVEIDKRQRELEKTRGSHSVVGSSRFDVPRWDISRRISRASSRLNQSNTSVNSDSEEDDLQDIIEERINNSTVESEIITNKESNDNTVTDIMTDVIIETEKGEKGEKDKEGKNDEETDSIIP